MSGHLFDDVSPITKTAWRNIQSNLMQTLFDMGATEIVPVGSTGLRDTMGDIDLAVRHPGGRDVLMSALERRFQARKTGKDLASIRYPLDGQQWVQVDLMVGNPDFLKWSRSGSLVVGVKNSCRAILINEILKWFSEFQMSSAVKFSTTQVDRVRYVLDFGSGLYIVKQTLKGKNCKILKSWKTINTVFISDEPDVIVERMFGKGFEAHELTSLSGIVNALKTSSIWPREHAKIVLMSFKSQIHALAEKSPETYGNMAVVDLIVDV